MLSILERCRFAVSHYRLTSFKLPRMKNLRILWLLVSMVSISAHAQWAWIGKDERKVFSDRAPPVDISDHQIFKRPSQVFVVTPTVRAELPASSASAPVAAQAALSASKPSGIDKELAQRKKNSEQIQAEKRRAEEDKLAKAKAENCDRAKQAQAGLESGSRIVRLNKQGIREVLDDTERSAELRRVQAVVQSQCN